MHCVLCAVHAIYNLFYTTNRAVFSSTSRAFALNEDVSSVMSYQAKFKDKELDCGE